MDLQWRERIDITLEQEVQSSSCKFTGKQQPLSFQHIYRGSTRALCLSSLIALMISAPGFAKTGYFPTDEDPYTLRGLAFEQYVLGHGDQALSLFRKAVDNARKEFGEESSFVGDLYFEMGTLALDDGKFVHAEEFLSEAVKHNPNSVMARLKLAQLYETRSKHDLALHHIQQSVAKHRNSLQARQALVQLLQQRGYVAAATRESFNISQMADGKLRIAPPLPKPVENTRLAVMPPKEEPKESPEKTPPKVAQIPVLPVVKPVPPPAKPKLPPKPAKPAKVDKKLTIKPVSKPPVKPVAKPVEIKQAVQPAVSNPSTGFRIDGKAELLKAKQGKLQVPADQSKATPPKKEEPPKPVEAQPVAKVPPPPVATRPIKAPGKPPRGLVPPPPPMVPVFPGVPQMMPPQQPVVIRQEPPKPKPKPKVEKPPEESAPSASDGDPEFILEWAEAGNKKKKK